MKVIRQSHTYIRVRWKDGQKVQGHAKKVQGHAKFIFMQCIRMTWTVTDCLHPFRVRWKDGQKVQGHAKFIFMQCTLIK